MSTQELSVNEIVPGLYLGNKEAAENENFLKSAKIKLIINATQHIPCKKDWKDPNFHVDCLQIPMNDPGFSPYMTNTQEDNVMMLENLPFVLDLIHQRLQKYENVLVHCHAGVQRSATIVFLYLYTYVYQKGTKKDRIIYSSRHILKNRPCVFNYGTGMSFHPAMKEYIHGV
jgi:protein-tyrosine phosphatase